MDLVTRRKTNKELSGQNRRKSSLKQCVFVSLPLKIQCHIVKNTLLQTAFSAILPTGLILVIEIRNKMVKV